MNAPVQIITHLLVWSVSNVIPRVLAALDLQPTSAYPVFHSSISWQTRTSAWNIAPNFITLVI